MPKPAPDTAVCQQQPNQPNRKAIPKATPGGDRLWLDSQQEIRGQAARHSDATNMGQAGNLVHAYAPVDRPGGSAADVVLYRTGWAQMARSTGRSVLLLAELLPNRFSGKKRPPRGWALAVYVSPPVGGRCAALGPRLADAGARREATQSRLGASGSQRRCCHFSLLQRPLRPISQRSGLSWPLSQGKGQERQPRGCGPDW